MSFKALFSIETLAAILGAALVTFLVDVADISPYWLLLSLPLFGLVVGYNMARQRLGVFRSGVVGYLDQFAFPSGRSLWGETSEELAYWGVTGASIAEDLKAFLHEEKGESRRYRFLLMSTKGESIREQIAFKKGYPMTGRSSEQDVSIDAEVAVEDQRLLATVAVLKSTRAFKSSPSRMEIRLYDEFLPWWVYLLDRKRIVVGILRVGQETGEQPAAVLTKNPVHVTLFESLHENFERVWRSSRPL